MKQYGFPRKHPASYLAAWLPCGETRRDKGVTWGQIPRGADAIAQHADAAKRVFGYVPWEIVRDIGKREGYRHGCAGGATDSAMKFAAAAPPEYRDKLKSEIRQAVLDGQEVRAEVRAPGGFSQGDRDFAALLLAETRTGKTWRTDALTVGARLGTTPQWAGKRAKKLGVDLRRVNRSKARRIARRIDGEAKRQESLAGTPKGILRALVEMYRRGGEEIRATIAAVNFAAPLYALAPPDN